MLDQLRQLIHAQRQSFEVADFQFAPFAVVSDIFIVDRVRPRLFGIIMDHPVRAAAGHFCYCSLHCCSPFLFFLPLTLDFIEVVFAKHPCEKILFACFDVSPYF